MNKLTRMDEVPKGAIVINIKNVKIVATLALALSSLLFTNVRETAQLAFAAVSSEASNK